MPQTIAVDRFGCGCETGSTPVDTERRSLTATSTRIVHPAQACTLWSRRSVSEGRLKAWPLCVRWIAQEVGTCARQRAAMLQCKHFWEGEWLSWTGAVKDQTPRPKYLCRVESI